MVEKITNDTVIKNISYDQSEILMNIMQLHNNGQPFECDITASELKFYKKNKKSRYDIPVPNILMDVYPQSDDIIKITPFHKLPLEDNSISSIVVDLPFVISPKTCKSKTTDIKEGSNLISNRFSSFYPADELFENIYWWIKECYRVLKEDGICVWKMESSVSGGREVWSVPFSFMVADRIGFYILDEFILEAKARLVSQKTQKHARKYTSTFWVFKKDEKKAKVNSCFKWLKQCEEQNLEGKVWIEPKERKRLGLDEKQPLTPKKLSYYEEMKQKALKERFNFDAPINNKQLPTVEINPVIDPIRIETSFFEIDNKKKTKNKAVIQVSLNGEMIKEWDSCSAVTKALGISSSSLSQCINGKIKSAGGYRWQRKDIGD